MRALVFGEDDQGAIVYGHAGTPLLGSVDTSNSVSSTQPDAGFWLVHSYEAQRRQLIVGDSKADRVVLYRPGERTTTTLAVGTIDPDVSASSVTLEIAVTATGAPPTGRTRVYSDRGERCEGTRQRTTHTAGTFVSHSECVITFATGGSRELRAEHFGDGAFGYSSSTPASVSIVRNPMFEDGFE